MFTPTSVLPEIDWPALPEPATSQLFARMHQLGESEWWPVETMREQQRRQCELLLRHAIATVLYNHEPPAYQAALDPGLSDKAWRALPPLTRDDVQRNNAGLEPLRAPAENGPVHSESTSGSTAMPDTIKRTTLLSLYEEALNLRRTLRRRRDHAA